MPSRRRPGSAGTLIGDPDAEAGLRPDDGDGGPARPLTGAEFEFSHGGARAVRGAATAGGRRLRRAGQPGAGAAGPGLGRGARRCGGGAHRRSPAAAGLRCRGPPGRRLAGRGRHRSSHSRAPRGAARRRPPGRGARRRYALLAGWCRRRGALHLLLAHQQEDQAETLLLRLARGSGLSGLAAMPAVAERGGLRLLRPLLAVPRARLAALLRAAGQPWIEDPSNRDPAYGRVRLRRLAPALAAEGLTAPRLADTAARLGQARAALEAELAAWLAAAAAIRPEGYLWLDRGRLAAARPDLALAALGRCLATVGGADYPPRLERLERLCRALLAPDPGAATLGGCRVVPRGGRLLLCREPAAASAALPLLPGGAVLWDGRFRLARRRGGDPRPLAVARLGALRPAGAAALPRPVRPGLPALYRDGALVGVPHLGHWSGLAPAERPAIAFVPPRPLADPGFTVALPGAHLI
ncbi:MAG: ATP-binding protein [Dongiaceae bacterium]